MERSPSGGGLSATSQRRRLLSVFARLALAAAAAIFVLAAPGRASAAACQASSPVAGSYTATVCLTQPADASTAKGAATVSATVSFTGTPPAGIQRMIFYVDGQYLLTDYATPYTFTLPSDRFVDGAHVVEVAALLRDTFTTARAGITLTFANGVTTPPVNTRIFTPAIGTAAPAGRPLVVGAAGDGAGGEQTEADVVGLITSWNANLFLYLGDVYEKATITEFLNWYDPPGYYGDLKAITNPAIGNHEYEFGVAPGYFDYWDNIPHYYSFDAGGWHFVSLDANAGYDLLVPGTPEYDWIAADLATSPACTLVFYHQPRWNIGQEGEELNVAQLWSLLADKGVDLVVNGHDHTYQRYVPLDGAGNPSPAGPTQFISGAGGHALGSFVTTSAKLAAGVARQYGALRLELWPAGAGWQFINTSGTILDSGGRQCSGTPPDTAAPSAPGSLAATASSYTQVDLTWKEPNDNVAIAGYDVYRDKTKIASLGLVNGYVDRTVGAKTTYKYAVRARDPAGNVSAESGSATVTTPNAVTQFSDGFETGNMSSWTSSVGLVATTAQRFAGTYGAEAVSTGTASYATKTLPAPVSDLYYMTRFKVVSQGANSLNLLRLKAAAGAKLASFFLSAAGKLSYRNDQTVVTTTGATIPTQNAWHNLELHVQVNGAAGKVEVWLDDVKLTDLSQTDSLGTAQIASVEIGDANSGRSFDVAFDDVKALISIANDTTPPTVPPGLAGSAADGPKVVLNWNPATDNVGVTGYDVFRGGTLLASLGATTTYTDTAVAAHTSYSYQVRARDISGNVSALSAATTIATGGLFADGFETGDLSRWTAANGVVAQRAEVGSGVWAARATTVGTGVSAYRDLASPQQELYTRLRFKVVSQGANALFLLKLRTATAAPILGAFISANGKLGYRDDVTGLSTTSSVVVGPGWHTLIVHSIVKDPSSSIDVSFDGVPVPELGKAETFGTTAPIRIEIGDAGTNKTFDVAIDDVLVDSIPLPESVPPAAPANLTAKPVAAMIVQLDWSAATDNVGVTGYSVFRSGTRIATLAPGATSYLDLGADPGTAYSYAVTASDAAGNTSPASNVAFLSTPPGLFADGFETGDLSKWTSTSGMTAQQQEVHGGAWAVRMTSAGGSAATKVYKTLATPQTDVYVRTWFKVVSLSTTTTMIKLRDAAGTHILSVFTDPNGTIGLKNELSGASTASTAVAALGAWHQVLLHFIVNGTASQTEVWLDGSRIAALSKTDSLGTNAVGRVELGNTTTPRTYDIVFDDAAVDARLNDTAAPTVPAGLTATAVSGFEVDLAWQPSTDNVGIAGYDVFRNGTQIASLGPVTSYVDSSVAALTTYTYQVRARDSWANVSALSAGVTATTLRGNVFADDFESGTLASWAPVNGLAVQQQLVYAGAWAARATSSGTVTLPATGASAQAVLPADQPDLYYRVKFQLVGAGANPVNLLRFRTRAGTAVVTVSLSTAGALGYRNDVAALTTTSTTTVAPGRWYELEAHVLVNGAASQVDVWLDGAKVAALSKTEALGSAGIGRIELGDTSTTRTFDVAFDDARADTTFIPESTPPSTPANLLATVVSETRVDLTWNASTDVSGVTGYTIYRDGTKIGAVDGATRSYSDTAAPAGKTSTYTVTATDAVGNVSKPSDPATATTPDTTPPTQPTGLTAQAPTQNRVDLSWTASTDNVGVVGYEIFRDGLSLAISTTNTYSDTTVAANTTYSYSVAARDAAGNLSPASAPPTVVTTAPLPPTTLTFTPTDDTYVQQDAPTTNFGTATQIIADNSPVKRLLLKFTVSGIGTRKVVSVKLRLRCVDASPFGGNFHRVADTSWTEGGVNWNTQPTADAATLATLGAVSANTTYEVDLTALVTRDGTYAIQADSTNADGAHYSSKEGAVTPQLVVSVSG